MKRLTLFVAVAFIVALALPAFAGNGAPSGPHYNLNIIGVDNPKNTTMTGSDRHTIFVALGSKNQEAITKIYLTQGEFEVCDGNGFDAAYDCSGSVIASGNNGAVFQLPCNLLLPATGGGVTLYPCQSGAKAYYEVWARALGSPKNTPEVNIKTCATEVGDINGNTTPNETLCSLESALLIRMSGKREFQNVTNALTSICIDTADADLLCDKRYALFRSEFQDWFWQYANKGVKLSQLRFYLYSEITY